jgi:hypothetical protein
MIDSKFKSNTFKDFDTMGFCIAKKEILPGNTVSSCIDENCLFQVENCSYCNSDITFNLNVDQLNISCIFVSPVWIWNFKNKTSDSIYLETNFEVENNTFFEGNLVVQSNSSIIFNITDFNQLNFVNISGELNIEGQIIINLESRPNQTDISFLLFNHNGTAHVSDSNLKVTTNYKDSKCDKIDSSVSNLPNSLFVQLTTDFGANCVNRLGIILGLSLGVPLFLIVLITFIFFILRRKMKKDAKEFQKEWNQNDVEMKWNSNNSSKVENEQTWQDFNKEIEN